MTSLSSYNKMKCTVMHNCVAINGLRCSSELAQCWDDVCCSVHSLAYCNRSFVSLEQCFCSSYPLQINYVLLVWRVVLQEPWSIVKHWNRAMFPNLGSDMSNLSKRLWYSGDTLLAAGFSLLLSVSEGCRGSGFPYAEYLLHALPCNNCSSTILLAKCSE